MAGTSYSVDAKGNIFKNGVYVPASNYSYIPSAIITQAHNVKAAATKSAGGTVVNTKPTATTKTPASTTTPTMNTSSSSKSSREAEKAKYTGWDNDPAVRTIQEKWWNIYVDTGRKDTVEQIHLHDEAEKARTYNNPMYGGSASGPVDWIDAEKITPRDTTPGANTIEGAVDGALVPENFGGYLKAGVGVIVLMMVFSMFRGRR